MKKAILKRKENWSPEQISHYLKTENGQKYCHTITSDNGIEFAQYTEIAKRLSIKFYFARPYHSWDHGTNENTNGLIQQYFPKNRNLLTVTKQKIKENN